MGLSWNTVARWLQRAAEAAERFTQRMLRGYILTELQADEIRTFEALPQSEETWIYLAMTNLMLARLGRGVQSIAA